ncbi:MAG: penicillin-binding transpeptidase domain-containing protein, partial [Acidobacteriota bacterium]
VWTALGVTLAGLWLVYRLDVESSRLALGRLELLQGRPLKAQQLFSEHRAFWWHRDEARAGLILARTLAGSLPGSETEHLAPAGLQDFPLRILLNQCLQMGGFESGLQLAQLAGRAGEASAPLYAAAFLLELGRAEEAAQGWLALPRRFRRSRLGQAVNTALQSLQDPSTVPVAVRDREGRLLGEIDAAGELQVAEGIQERLVPRAAIEHLEPLLKSGSDAPALRMSLDLELSRIANKALGGFRGSIVLVEPSSGEILAAVSDRKTWRAGGTPAFEQRLEPASISKLITVTAAMRAGVDVDAEISKMICRGRQRYQGGVLRCAFRAGPLLNASRAMALSCNLAFANLGRQIGRQAVLDELRRFGFGTTSGGFELGRILQPYGDERQLADLSIGLEATDITPLHAALLAATFANHGAMPVPTLIHSKDGLLGFSPRPAPVAAGRPVVDPRWLPDLLQMMREVVESGTASGVARVGFPVAMKTGTGRNPDQPLHSNYIGIGPLPRPRVAFCVRITNFWSNGKLKYATVRVTRRLLQGLKEFYGQDHSTSGWDVAGKAEEVPRRGAEARRGGGEEGKLEVLKAWQSDLASTGRP